MLKIVKAGAHTSIQDLGRSGLRNVGVTQGGALDPISLRLANRLVDNPCNAAALEIFAGPVECLCEHTCWVALGGALMDVFIDGQQQGVSSGWRFLLTAGQTLKLNGPIRGRVSYLSLQGGIDVPRILGARATDLKARFGGLEGRLLKNGDSLPLFPCDPSHIKKKHGIQQDFYLQLSSPYIRVLTGPEWDQLDDPSQHQFLNGEWRVTANSNRMGYRMQGVALQRTQNNDLLSHAVYPGVIQLPPNGQPIVLMADAQTCGGYPKIATVIAADLPVFAQLPMGRQVRFIAVTMDEAREALVKTERNFEQWDRNLHDAKIAG